METSTRELELLVANLVGQHQAASNRLHALEEEHSKKTGRKLLIERALELAVLCMNKAENKRSYIEYIISEALSDVYQANYKFVLEPQYDTHKNIKGLLPRISVEGSPGRDPRKGMGRGSLDVCNVVFHMLALLMTSETLPVLIMDEPWPFISNDMQEELRAFLQNVCSRTNLQIIMTTQQSAPFGLVYHVGRMQDDVGAWSVARVKGERNNEAKQDVERSDPQPAHSN